ncbi:MAG: hypothetical protein OEZ18_06090 [Candidatus Bathyarchaeota archaeon]|nr:hypothetical protein [Candidatus Bathyarchaeota archaeon]
MLDVTLDNNCIIDLEQNNAIASHLRKLIQMHCDHKINLRVVAISASERKPDQTYVSHFDEFKERINKIGLGDVKILETIAYVGLSFVGYCLVGGGALEELESEIQGILFPRIELCYSDFCKKRNLDPNDEKAWRKWTNIKCDVLALWSHVWYKGDIFVTTDKHFHKKTVKPRLVKLGAGKILRPDEAVKLLASEEGSCKDKSEQIVSKAYV